METELSKEEKKLLVEGFKKNKLSVIEISEILDIDLKYINQSIIPKINNLKRFGVKEIKNSKYYYDFSNLNLDNLKLNFDILLDLKKQINFKNVDDLEKIEKKIRKYVIILFSSFFSLFFLFLIIFGIGDETFGILGMGLFVSHLFVFLFIMEKIQIKIKKQILLELLGMYKELNLINLNLQKLDKLKISLISKMNYDLSYTSFEFKSNFEEIKRDIKTYFENLDFKTIESKYEIQLKILKYYFLLKYESFDFIKEKKSQKIRNNFFEKIKNKIDIERIKLEFPFIVLPLVTIIVFIILEFSNQNFELFSNFFNLSSLIVIEYLSIKYLAKFIKKNN